MLLYVQDLHSGHFWPVKRSGPKYNSFSEGAVSQSVKPRSPSIYEFELGAHQKCHSCTAILNSRHCFDTACGYSTRTRYHTRVLTSIDVSNNSSRSRAVRSRVAVCALRRSDVVSLKVENPTAPRRTCPTFLPADLLEDLARLNSRAWTTQDDPSTQLRSAVRLYVTSTQRAQLTQARLSKTRVCLLLNEIIKTRQREFARFAEDGGSPRLEAAQGPVTHPSYLPVLCYALPPLLLLERNRSSRFAALRVRAHSLFFAFTNVPNSRGGMRW